MVEFDRSAFVATFQAEASEYLQRLNEGVITLEGDPGDRPLVEQMLRDAHTLKGSSRMVGLIGISDVAHRLEDVMVAIRDGSLAFTPAMSDVFFEALDTMLFLVEHAQEAEASPPDVGPVSERLAALLPPEADEDGETAREAATATVVASAGGAARRAAEACAGPVTVTAPPATDAWGRPKVAPAPEPEEALEVKEMSTFRVRAEQVDAMLNLVSEVVIAQIKQEKRAGDFRGLLSRSGLSAKAWVALRDEVGTILPAGDPRTERLSAMLHAVDEEFGSQRKALFDLAKGYTDDLSRTAAVVDDLQHRSMELRMLPVSTVFAAYPRAVRDMARGSGKLVELRTEGGETQLDKKVLEEIADPLVHLIRNAMDHGIERPDERTAAGKPETGTISISARQEGDRIAIELSDDGAGIDPDKIRAAAVQKGHITQAEARALTDRQALYLIFESGFSTSPIITEISGRGVGLDVVRRFIVERLKGGLDVFSEVGKGTTFRVRIPLTLAIIRTLLLRAGGQAFAMPTAAVDETVLLRSSLVERLEGRDVIRRGLRTIPLVRLTDLLGMERAEPTEYLNVVVVGQEGVRVGFVVDAFDGEQQVVIKSLGKHLRSIEHFAGATILGAGDVVLILDVPRLVTRARSRGGVSPLPLPDAARIAAPVVRGKVRRVLICEDSFTTRELERSIFEAAGYVVETATDGAMGLTRLKEGLEVDAVVTDVQMPRMDGFMLTRAIKADERLRVLPVVVVTSLERDEEKTAGIEAGADAYITKSVFNQDTLLDTVERLMR